MAKTEASCWETDRRRSLLPAWWPLGVALVLGLLLRLARIGVREAWLDEACTSLFAQSTDLGALLATLRVESHPPLYYLLMYGWTAIAGTAEEALRFPSTVAGLVLTVLLYAGVRARGGDRLAAGLAALVGAASPLLVYYSVEAKAYTLLWALAAGTWLSLERAVRGGAEAQGPGVRRAFGAALLLHLAALYTHHFALLLLPLWPLALFAVRGRARAHGLVAAALLLLGYAPWALGFLVDQSAAGGTSWLEAYWQGAGTALAGSARIMAIAPPFPPYLGELAGVALPTALTVPLLAVFGLPVLGGLYLCLWRSADRPAARLLLPALLLLPTVGLAVLSLWRPLYLVGRYELLAYPAWIVLWALGFGAATRALTSRLQGRAEQAARAAMVTLVVVGLLVPLWPYVVQPPKPWFHAAAARRLVAESEAPGEPAVIAVGLTRAPLEHQLRRLTGPGVGPRLLSFPPDVAEHVGWFEPSRYSTVVLREQARALAVALAGEGDVWIALPLAQDGRPADLAVVLPLIEALAATGRRQTETIPAGRLGLARFTRANESSPQPVSPGARDL
jgi:4-amino-4-deoxy-L-arabinose transferase-like glycosyltransferase